MKNSLRIHKWTHNEFNIFILGVLTHPLFLTIFNVISCISQLKDVTLAKNNIIF